MHHAPSPAPARPPLPSPALPLLSSALHRSPSTGFCNVLLHHARHQLPHWSRRQLNTHHTRTQPPHTQAQTQRTQNFKDARTTTGTAAPGPTAKTQKQPECRGQRAGQRRGAHGRKAVSARRKNGRETPRSAAGKRSGDHTERGQEKRKDKRHVTPLRAGIPTWIHMTLLRKRKQPHKRRLPKGKVCSREGSAGKRTQTHYYL